MSLSAYTAVERQAIQTVLNHQLTFLPIPLSGSPSGAATEMHIAIDSTGTAVIDQVIHPATGGHMTEKMQAAAVTEAGCRIIHNHPSQHSLSHSDWNVLAAHPSVEMTAVNSHGTTFRGKVLDPGAFADWATMMTNLPILVTNCLSQQVTAWISQGLWDVVDVSVQETWIVGWAIGDRLQAKSYALFECIPAGAQIAACSTPAAKILRAALDRFCVAEIL